MKDWVEWHIKSANICAASEKYIINDKEKENDEMAEEVCVCVRNGAVLLPIWGVCFHQLSEIEIHKKKLKFYGCQPFC